MPITETIVHAVLHLQNQAAQRGLLNVWTIYDHPKDYPADYCARCHEIGKKEGQMATNSILVLDLEDLRDAFRASGLVCVPRQEKDDAVIVESWV